MSRVENTGVAVPSYPQTPVADGKPSVIALLNSDDQLALELGGDVHAQLAAMVLKHGSERREALDEARGKQEQYVREMEQEQVSKMRTEAQHLRDKAWLEGSTKVAGAGLQVTGALAGSGGDNGINYGKALEAGGNAAVGAGEMVGAGQGFRANMASADGTAADHKAQEGLRRIEALRDDIEDIKDFEQAGRDFLKAIQNIETQTNNAILFQRV